MNQKHIETLTEMALGLEMSAVAEGFIVEGLQDARVKFHANDRDPITMRRLRVLLDAEKATKHFTTQAEAIRALLQTQEVKS